MKLCWDAVWLESFYLFKTLENRQKENPRFQWFHVTKYNNKIKQQYKKTVSSWYNFHYKWLSGGHSQSYHSVLLQADKHLPPSKAFSAS